MQRHMTTTRIVLPRDRVIYTTSQIATTLKEHLIRLNQRLHPKAGHSTILENKLHDLAKQRPLEFANGSLEILGLSHLKHYKNPQHHLSNATATTTTTYNKPWLKQAAE